MTFSFEALLVKREHPGSIGGSGSTFGMLFV